MGIAAILGVAGSLVSGFAAMQQASYSAAIAEANAQQARLNAEHEVEVAYGDLESMGEEQAGIMGEQMGRVSTSGLAITSPSINQARHRARRLAIQDQRRRIDASYRTAANYKTQANMFDAEAKAHKTAGTMAMLTGVIGAGRSLVGGSATTGAGFGESMMARKQTPGPRFFNI